MNYIDRFRDKMEISGNNLKGELIRNSRKLIEEVFKDDPSHKRVFVWRLGLLNPEDYENEPTIDIRFYGRKYSVSDGMTVKFQTCMNTPIEVGDVLYDIQLNLYLMCIESFDIDETHFQGKLCYCNWILKWQNEFGDILEYPCYDSNSTQYNSGESTNKQFTIGSSQHAIRLPCDGNTCNLSSPKRFYLDKAAKNPTSFVLTQNDTTSYNYGKKGIVKLTLLESLEDSETDRPDLGICDYIDKKEQGSSEFDRYSEINYKTTIIKSGGSFQKFYGRFFIGDVESDRVKCSWEVIYDYADKLNISIKDNYIEIGVDDDSLVDDEFKLCLHDEKGEYSSSYLIIKIGRLF